MKVLMIYFNTAARASFPLGLTSLVNYIKNEGHHVEIFDTSFYKEFFKYKRENVREKFGFYKKIANPIEIKYIESTIKKDLKHKIDNFKPDIIGLSILSAHFMFSLTISKFIKEHFSSIPIIVGGLHPTIKPEETIKEVSIDMICIGEGEYPFSYLLEKMDRGKSITNIKGIWVKQGKKIFRNELGLLTDPSDFPKTNWDLFSPQHIYAPLDGRIYRMGSVEFSRGCPYSCSYCSINYLRDAYRPQKYLRRKSVEKSIEELIYLKNKYNIEMFYFLDETFLSNDIKSLIIFAEEYKRQVAIPFHGLTHPLSVNEQKVKLLKEMGCYLMTIGIECGNENFRKKYLNRNVPTQKIIEAFKLFHKYDIFPSGFGMIGLPYETRDLVYETIELFRTCQPRTCSISIYQPFPGGRLRDICIKEGFFDPSEDNYIYPAQESILKMPQFSKEDINSLYRSFILYTKVPKNKFPLVQKAEKDDILFENLVRQYV